MRRPPFVEAIKDGVDGGAFDLIFTVPRFPLRFVRIVLYILAPLYPALHGKNILLVRSFEQPPAYIPQAIDTPPELNTIVGIMSTIKPISDRVFLEPMEEDRMTKSGIVLPDSAEKERPVKGRVLAVGAGKLNDNGSRNPMSVKVGDVVLFKKYGPDELELEGKKYLVAEESDILAVLES